jgi:hypothetical protein
MIVENQRMLHHSIISAITNSGINPIQFLKIVKDKGQGREFSLLIIKSCKLKVYMHKIKKEYKISRSTKNQKGEVP